MRRFFGVIAAVLIFVTACSSTGTENENHGDVNQKTDAQTIAMTTEAAQTVPEQTQNTKQREIMENYIKEAQHTTNFLYDVTGDNFPELIEIVPMFYKSDYELYFYDFSGGEPKQLTTIGCNAGDKIYICQDENKNRFLLSFQTSYGTAGKNEVEYVKTDIDGHYMISGILGRSVNYIQSNPKADDCYYNAILYFDGELIETLGRCDVTTQNDMLPSEELLKQYFEEYLDKVEILDEITMPQTDSMEAFLQEMDKKKDSFTYIPDYNYEEWFQKTIEPKRINICGTYYDSESTELYLSANILDETFDSDVLNQFPDLRSVTFDGKIDGEILNKIIIKPSEWCERIMSLSINGEMYELSGDFSSFSNIQEVTFWGDIKKAENLDYVKSIPQVKVLNLYQYFGSERSETEDFVKIIEMVSKLPDLEVVTYSGHNVFFSSMTEEEQNKVYELLSDKIFSCIK